MHKPLPRELKASWLSANAVEQTRYYVSGLRATRWDNRPHSGVWVTHGKENGKRRDIWPAKQEKILLGDQEEKYVMDIYL